MDTLGIKDPIQSLTTSKNAKKSPDQWTGDEQAADNKMIVSHVLGEDGASFYTCTIPWKNGSKPSLINNAKSIKMRQDKTTTSGYLSKKGTSMEEILEYFNKLETKGYIKEIDTKLQTEEDSYYLPWFPVIDRTRDTTKMRMVFDASAKDKNSKSLNSEIETTPNRLNDLATILMRFRRYKYTLTADVSEMFLRIRMVEQDQKYHRFFIGDKLYQWQSVIFGEMSSPDISQKVINAAADSQNLPLAKMIVNDSTYMDDTIVSLKTEGEVLQACGELLECYKKCNMTVAKFYTNSELVVNSLPKEILSKKVSFTDKDIEISASKVLGMIYDAKTDKFKYSCKFESITDFFDAMKLTSNTEWTKRLVLRFSATVYDPLGFISPFSVKARSILQELWITDLGWDDPIPLDIKIGWRTWLTEIFQIQHLIKIPRHIHMDSMISASLHIFVDASTQVFATCAYLVMTYESRKKYIRQVKELEKPVVISRGEKTCKIKSYLVAAKARVTPSKTESVSRLELAACVIGVRLGHAVAKSYDIDPEDITYWTDSKNCLFWLNTSSSMLKTYVAHRVGEIQNHSRIENWRPVPTALNPADIATRPPTIQALANSKEWFSGPKFLTEPEVDWPAKFVPPEPNEDGKAEFKKYIFSVKILPDDHPDKNVRPIDVCLDPARYSVGKWWDGYVQLVKRATHFVTLLCRREYSPAYYQSGLKFLLEKAQEDSPDISKLKHALEHGYDITDKRFKSLNPKIDRDGLIKANTRLEHCANLPYDTKFPTILDKHGRFTKLLVKSYHFKYGHAVGEESIKAHLKAKYYILGLNQMVTAARTGCKVCDDRRRKPFVQIESPLPAYRFETPLRAFAKTGLDFAGPFEVKIARSRAKHKVYILVFTCMQVRAVHLEVTDSQDMTAVMHAFSRFVDARGMPTDILSDNFSTFVSKDKELESWVRYLNKDDIIDSVLADVKWHTTPPLGPHHGGIYESMVKSAKRALKELTPERVLLDFDTFRTLVSRAAYLVNSRPLKRVTDESKSYILTPNHFLMGSLGGAVTPNQTGSFRKWKEIDRLQAEFWSLWIKHYLPELKRLRRWKVVKPDVQIGQVVCELLPNFGVGRWRLARVIELIPSADGKIRKVKIKNSLGVFERAITSLYPVELGEDLKD